MNIKRIENAVNIINYAISNNISVSEASVKFGYYKTYVKNIKLEIFDLYNKDLIDYEIFALFNNTYEKYLNNKKFININNDSIKNKIKNKNLQDDGTYESTLIDSNNNIIISQITQIDNNSSSNSNSIKHIKTLDELLEAANIDLNVWKVDSYTINKWDVTSWKNNKPETIQNWQVKAKLIKDIKVFREEQIGDIFINMIKDYTPPVYVPSKNKSNSNLNDENNLLEISIFDLHLGKLAWAGETFENYDIKIARKRFLSSIETLMNRAIGFNINRILFPIGSDFFNSDTIYNTTTKGTQQDEDSRWQKTFDVGCRLIIDGINLLKNLEVPIDVITIPGNHDFERNYYLGKFISAWYNSDPQVNINTHASPRKYYRFGQILLGLTHGSEEKEDSLPLLMATDIQSKPMWSETKFHEWHLGHIHRKKNVNYNIKTKTLSEELGVTIRYLSSLTGTEEWHHKKGFVGNIKAADAFIWNSENGLIAHLNSNIKIE